MNTSFPNAVSLSKQQESSLPSTTGATSVTSDLSATREEEHDRTLKSNRTSYYYLTPNAVSRLPDYRYQGEDLSLLYKYVLSPLASWCVDNLTPRWVAPNAITTCGLCWMIAAYSIVWYHCPDLYEANTDVFSEGTVPRWIFLFNCSAMLIYQTLDNMDGKQARRTGTGSALGLLFDHGCDAVNSIFGSGNWIVAMALAPGNVADLNVDSTITIIFKRHCCYRNGSGRGTGLSPCVMSHDGILHFDVGTVLHGKTDINPVQWTQ